MNRLFIHSAAVLCLLFGIISSASATTPEDANTGQPSPKLVVLKFDDVVAGRDGHVVSERWQRVADFLEGKKIKASMGVIGWSLIDYNSAYFKWITDRATPCGYIEFWNHGYQNRRPEDVNGEFERSYEEQLYYFRMTDSLAYARLGIQFAVWGPHYSSDNEFTDLAIAQLPQIRMTFTYPRKAVHYKGFVLKNRLNFEFPTSNPDFEAFMKEYLVKSKDWEYFFMQGHPNNWDETRWQNFVKVIEFLEKEGVRFVTPTELYVILKTRGEI